jgi:putative restriction endonuclease
VEDHWRERGRDGFFVCRYRLLDRASRNEEGLANKQEPAPRKPSTILRIVRDTGTSKQVKALQSTGVRYAARRSKPVLVRMLRVPTYDHSGIHIMADEAANLLYLCPNHHVLFDYGRFQINDDFSLLGVAGKLRTAPGT